ncbi:hypothetical protein MNJPNG_14935 [Cupriavidus oxalaticus]|uniref:hypothetical protein n=1 Tax=Cupriavidus oxalaticus TaxID=96344 RepID=UPI003F73C435
MSSDEMIDREHLGKLNVEAAKLTMEAMTLSMETMKLAVEAAKNRAELDKQRAESEKLRRNRWLPVVVAAAAGLAGAAAWLGIAVAAGKFFFGG